MLTYEEMQYFAAFAELGTLTEVAEKYHISQPTITRAMKRAEQEFDVPLFQRTRNRIFLNDNGKLAAEEVRRILDETEEMIRRVRAYDRSCRTITVGSAAAVQLPGLITRISAVYPDKAIYTELKLPDELVEGFRRGEYRFIILPWDPSGKEGMEPFCSRKIGEEHLMFLFPKGHRFARRRSLSLQEMNGENMLLFSEIGFWADIVRRKMPDSRFLVQNERYSFRELVANSVLPCFTTDLAEEDPSQQIDQDVLKGRVSVPIRDPEVNVEYFLVCRKEDKKILSVKG